MTFPPLKQENKKNVTKNAADSDDAINDDSAIPHSDSHNLNDHLLVQISHHFYSVINDCTVFSD